MYFYYTVLSQVEGESSIHTRTKSIKDCSFIFLIAGKWQVTDVLDTYLTFMNVHSALYRRQGDPHARVKSVLKKTQTQKRVFMVTK